MAHLKTLDEKLVVDIQLTSSAPPVTGEYDKLAQQLSQIHGTVRVAREKNGIHFYLASPFCLENFGEEELYKLHLAVNAEKYLSDGEAMVGMCMKSGEVYSIHDLLAMPRLDQRGYDHKPHVVLKKEADQQYLEPDEHGNLVPKSPGTVIPIIDLPEEHQAIQYLRSRNFDPVALYEQFRLSYCEKERTDIHYRRLLNGFRATPQGRIVFYIIQNGVVRGWQARILEIEHKGIVYAWQPYKRRWTPVLQAIPGQKPVPLPGWEDWDPAKYVIAHGCMKSECLMGYDAAVEFDWRAHQVPHFAVLSEGALDAGRIGAPAMAMLGKFLSDDQADLLQRAGFDPVIYVKDADEYGQKAATSVYNQFKKRGIEQRLKIVDTPPGIKDLGEFKSQYEALEFIYKYL